MDRELDVVPLALDRTHVMVGAGHELAEADELTLDEVLPFRMTPAVTPELFPQVLAVRRPARWQQRGPFAAAGAHGRRSPVRRRDWPGDLGGGLDDDPGPAEFFIRTVPLRDGPMSTIAVARQRADSRPVVRAFVESAVAGAAAGIGQLPGAILPN